MNPPTTSRRRTLRTVLRDETKPVIVPTPVDRWPYLLAGVGIFGLAVRVFYLAELRNSPVFAVLVGDGQQYESWASQIAAGHWMGTKVFFQTPLYPYLLAICFKSIGHSLMAVRLVQSVLGALSCVLLGVAGSRFFDRRVGLVAAILLAIYPPAIFFDGLIQKSSLDLFLLTALLASLGTFYCRPHWKWLIAIGVTLGAFVLNRENARILYPILIAWLFLAFRSQSLKTRVAWAALVTAACAVVLLPVGLRNYHVGGEFLISTSQFGLNLYTGNHLGASGTYDELVPGRGNVIYEQGDATRLAERAMGRHLSPSEESHYWSGLAVQYVRSHPWNWLALMGKKLVLTFSAKEIVDTESIEVYSDYSFVLRALLWFDFGIILPMGLLGAWRVRNRWREVAVLYAMLIGYTLSVVIFFVNARYRYPLVPIVLLFAAAAWSPLSAQRRDWRREWLPGVLLAGAALALCHIPLRVSHDETRFNIGSRLLDMGRPSEALPILREAVNSSPDFASAYYELGNALNATGDKKGAITQYEAATRLRPDHAEAQNALGLILNDNGQLAEAIEHFEQAVRAEPGFAEAHSNLGLALSQAGRRQEGLSHLRESIRLKPDDAMTRNSFASTLLEDGEFPEAIEQCETALRLRPDYPEAHNNLAIALKAAGDDDGALKHLQEAARLQPDNFGMQMNLGSLLVGKGRARDAIEHYRQAATLAPDSVEALFFLGEAYSRDGDSKAAVDSLEKALSLARSSGQTEAARQIANAIQANQERMSHLRSR